MADEATTVVGEATATTDANHDPVSTHAVQSTRTPPTPASPEATSPASSPDAASPAMPPAVSGTAIDGRARIGRLADELLPALIARLSMSTLGELEIREGTWRVRLRRAATPVEAAGDHAPRSRQSRAAAASSHAESPDAIGSGSAGQASARATASNPAAREPGRLEATSPAVGYYAPRDSVAIGQQVRQGDVLGHIDVLGVRQEVVAPLDGLLIRHLAESGEAVEYGQPLVRLERLSRSGARQVGDGDVVAVAVGAAPLAASAPLTASAPLAAGARLAAAAPVVSPATNGSGPAATADARRGPTGSTTDAATR